jgi:hypothetical protein
MGDFLLEMVEDSVGLGEGEQAEESVFGGAATHVCGCLSDGRGVVLVLVLLDFVNPMRV